MTQKPNTAINPQESQLKEVRNQNGVEEKKGGLRGRKRAPRSANLRKRGVSVLPCASSESWGPSRVKLPPSVSREKAGRSIIGK